MTDDRYHPDLPLSRQGDGFDKEIDHQHEKDELLLLERALRDMPDREPPADLVDKILRSVKPKKLSQWRRFLLWAAAPRSLTISPIKLVPVAVVVCVALVVTIHLLPKGEIPVNQSANKEVLVTFTFEHPQARSVSLIGSFNQWKPRGLEMRSRGEEKVWVLELRLPPGRYEYAFLVNGEVVQADPTSPFSERDGFGNQNSIIFVTDDYAKNI
jgi:hypothetical protein